MLKTVMNITSILSFTPNPIAISFIVCGLLNILFAIYLARRMNNTMTIFWFVLFIIVAAVADISYGFLNMSNTKEAFSVWLIVNDFLIITPGPLLFAFGVSFANKGGYLKKIWIIVPLIIIFFTMLFLALNTDYIFSHNIKEAVMTAWGIVPKAGIGNVFVGLYFLIIQISYVSILIYGYFKNHDATRRKQIKLMSITIIFTILATTITKGFLPQAFHWQVFPSDVYIQLLLVMATIYVLSKYGINALNIDSISEKILQLIPSSVMILNKENEIELINPSAEILFEETKKGLIGKPISNFFLDNNEYIKFIEAIAKPIIQKKEVITKLDEIKMKDGKQKEFSVNIQATSMKDLDNKNAEILVIFTSVQEILNQSTQVKLRLKEIEKQKTELEQMNMIMVDRETKMIELKKENEKLKAQLSSK